MLEKESDIFENEMHSFSVDSTVENGLQEVLYSTASMFTQGEISHVEFMRRMRDMVAISDNIDNIAPLYYQTMSQNSELLDAYKTEADTYYQQGMAAAERASAALEPLSPKSPKEVFVSNALSLTSKATGIECAKETIIEELASGEGKSEAIVSGGMSLLIQASFPLTTNYFLRDRRLYREEGIATTNKNPVVGASLVLADCGALVGTIAAAYTIKSPEVGIAVIAGIKTFYNYAAHGIMDRFSRAKK